MATILRQTTADWYADHSHDASMHADGGQVGRPRRSRTFYAVAAVAAALLALGPWRAILDTGVTHVLVHEAAFPERGGADITDWLKASGAREILMDGTDRLLTVR